MKVNSMEWKLVSQLQTHHDHPRYPKENNIQSSLEKGGWVERLQVVCLLRPTHHGEREEARGEPCIKNIGITFKYNFIAAASKELFCLGVCILLTPCHHPTIITLHVRLQNPSLSFLGSKPRRNLMPPPKLPAHAPIANVIQPLKPRLFVISRYNLQLFIAHSIRGPFRHATAVHVPLGRDHRLENVSRTRTQAQTHLIGFLPYVQAFFLQRLLYRNTGIITHQPLKLGSIVVDRPFRSEDRVEFELVTLATLVIVRIMGGSDLHRTSTEGHVNEGSIEDDGDAASVEGVDDVLSVEVFVPCIFRMDSHGAVSQHGFETGRRHNELLVRIFNWICKRSQHAKLIASLRIARVTLVRLDLQKRPPLQFDIIHLNVRYGRLQSATPIPQPLRPVQQSVFVEAIERLDDRLATHFIHGESLSAPIHRGSETAELGRDAIAILCLPFPYLFDEFFATEVVASQTGFFHKHFLYDRLSGDASVISSRNVQRRMSQHPMPSRQRVLHRGRQRVSQMQAPSNIRGRNHHDKLLVIALPLRRGGIARVKSGSLPPILPRRLDGLRMVCVGHGRLG
mmetsp:Transcript_20615/g.42993  ORF Transcript_20615/g.42993 Transcript_20615/m.42993 type:complete len:567 (-) Transcript_20615:452-2152(-)